MSQPTTWGCPRAADAPKTPEAVSDRIDDSLDALLSAHAAAARPSYAVEGTVWYDTDTDSWHGFDGTNDVQLMEIVAAPATATSTGKAGQVAYDGSYFYVCSAANTWLRVAIATWA